MKKPELCAHCDNPAVTKSPTGLPVCVGHMPMPGQVVDTINPSHYKSHPSGIECIAVTRHLSFNIGNAIKYLWRCDLKNGVEDLKKAVWYINDEINKRNKQNGNG